MSREIFVEVIESLKETHFAEMENCQKHAPILIVDADSNFYLSNIYDEVDRVLSQHQLYDNIYLIKEAYCVRTTISQKKFRFRLDQLQQNISNIKKNIRDSKLIGFIPTEDDCSDIKKRATLQSIYDKRHIIVDGIANLLSDGQIIIERYHLQDISKHLLAMSGPMSFINFMASKLLIESEKMEIDSFGSKYIWKAIEHHVKLSSTLSENLQYIYSVLSCLGEVVGTLVFLHDHQETLITVYEELKEESV